MDKATKLQLQLLAVEEEAMWQLQAVVVRWQHLTLVSGMKPTANGAKRVQQQ